MMTIEAAVGQRLLIAFDGYDAPSEKFLRSLTQFYPAGVTLFRSRNIRNPQQVHRLTTALQAAARSAGIAPLLIGADQEGGQLMAIGEGVTQLPGNLALGAVGSIELAHSAGAVLGAELSAMGINVDYAPSCDVNSNPNNPVIGTRSFGEDPVMVARLASATIAGIQSQGVAATAKHFPGHGDTSSDSHLGIPVVQRDLPGLEHIELPPFRAAVAAGVRLIMSAHVALPALTNREDLPSTLSADILTSLLRAQMGFQGVIVTDAMDMHAIRQGEEFGTDATRAAQAGADLLLITANPDDWHKAYAGIRNAVLSGQIAQTELQQSADRVLALKKWLAEHHIQHDLSVVGCSAHRKVAEKIADQSVTLVRDRANLLPLKLDDAQQLTVILPKPLDLTPADTSSYVIPSLAQAIREFHARTEEVVVSHAPDEAEISTVLNRIQHADLLIIGTLNAFTQPGQAALVNAVLAGGKPAIVVALRMPYDLAVFSHAPTYLCSYSILPPSMNALAKVLFGKQPARGRLPVSIPALYPLGHGE